MAPASIDANHPAWKLAMATEEARATGIVDVLEKAFEELKPTSKTIAQAYALSLTRAPFTNSEANRLILNTRLQVALVEEHVRAQQRMGLTVNILTAVLVALALFQFNTTVSWDTDSRGILMHTYLIVAIIVTLYQSYRGFMFQWVRGDSPYGGWERPRKFLLLALADGFFYLVTTASGFAALAASFHMFHAVSEDPTNVSGGTVTLLLFLWTYGILGVTAQLPPLIQQGKLLPR